MVENGGMTEKQALGRLYDAGLIRNPEIEDFLEMPDF
jgi:hypothetical protein